MGVLLMLMTIGGLVVAGFLLAISLIGKKTWLRNFTLGGVTVWFAFYVVMLFGFSFTSTEKTLAVNEPKAFCGFYLDCHVHAVVTGVRTAKTIGYLTANGQYTIIKVKVFSDARNPGIAFRLLEPSIVVKDGFNKFYERNEVVEEALPSADVYLGQNIRGRETVEKEIVFDLPNEVKDLRLDIREGYRIDQAIEAALVDDEDSLFHGRRYFKLQEQNDNAGL